MIHVSWTLVDRQNYAISIITESHVYLLNFYNACIVHPGGSTNPRFLIPRREKGKEKQRKNLKKKKRKGRKRGEKGENKEKEKKKRKNKEKFKERKRKVRTKKERKKKQRKFKEVNEIEKLISKG